MTQPAMNRLMDHLRRAAQTGDESLGDGELLGCFLERQEESAFAVLLRRHGPMVLGVCRRILGNVHDAEDAFQATFLILVRKAASVRPREAVGNWLYGVAYRTALEARTRIARRRGREKQMEDLPHPEVQPEEHWPELQPLLDRELHRLSDKYRLPVVLCDVEGRSRKEVARQLAIPEGTLSSRLATARKRLAERLTRHGFVFSGGSLAVLLADNAASAWVPASLSAATTKAAMLVAAGQTAAAAGVVSVTVATLTDGVLKAMLVAKLKTATVVLFGVAALGLGTGGLVYQTRAGAADARQADRALVTRSGAEEAQQERDRAQRAAEDARDRERALREELERARRELEAARAEARELRQRAEAERRRAEEVARALQDRLEAARRNEERARYADAVRRADAELRAEPNRRGGDADRRKALAEIEVMAARINEEFEQQRRKLQEQLKKLEKDRDEQFLKLKRRAELLQRQDASQPRPAGGGAPAGADKLDQILQRLERLEQRLDRLERRKN